MVYQRLFNLVTQGKVFVVSHRFGAVSSASSVYMYLENPSNSGKNIYLVAIEVISTGQFWVDIYVDNTVSSAGTTITPVNLNLESTNSSVAYVEYGGTYSLGTQIHQTVAPGGSGIRAIGSVVNVSEAMIMPPGKNIVIVATNQSASAEDMSIRIVWWEE